MVVATMVEEGVHIQKGLSEWWSEESEYLLQRIERWAALARGYNRLRSYKLSRGRLGHEEVLDEDEEHYSQSNYDLRRSERIKTRSPDETRKINCCGGFNYQSNSKLESNCLETYRYDHSIYFKTIGDIRKSKSGENGGYRGEQDGDQCTDDEKVEWDVRVVNNSLNSRGFAVDHQMVVMPDGQVRWDYLDKHGEDRDNNRINVWPVVDLRGLETEGNNNPHNQKNQDDQEEDERNNNVQKILVSRSKSSVELKSQQSMTGIMSFRTKRSPKVVRRPMVCGDNNVSWPGVLLTYTSSYVDPAVASSQNRIVKVK